MAVQKCYVCGKEYEVCHSCDGTRINPWRKTVCCPQHYQVRMVYFEYRDGSITADQAREMLEHIGITDASGLKEGYQDFFKQVFSSNHRVEEKSNASSLLRKNKKKK